jgi:Transcriptional regulator
MGRAYAGPRIEEVPQRGRSGRPRSHVAHQAILAAAIDLIRDVGYDAVTIEGVAAKAGVAKTTLYRRWSGKEVLVANAIEQIAVSIASPDTGTLRGDILAVLHSSVAMYRDPATGALLSGLVAAIARSETIAAAVRGGFVAARRKALRAVVERWIDRGELRPDLEVDVLMDMIAGPLFYRFLLRGEPVDVRLTEEILDILLRGITAGAPDNSTRGGTA